MKEERNKSINITKELWQSLVREKADTGKSISSLMEEAWQESRALCSAALQKSEGNLIRTEPSDASHVPATLSPTEPSEWASLAARASHVTGRIERSMYRSIRFQLEYLALVAQQQGINEPDIKIRYDDDGNLVVPVSDPSSPLHPPSGAEEPRRTGVGPVREVTRPAAHPVPKRRKVGGE